MFRTEVQSFLNGLSHNSIAHYVLNNETLCYEPNRVVDSKISITKNDFTTAPGKFNLILLCELFLKAVIYGYESRSRVGKDENASADIVNALQCTLQFRACLIDKQDDSQLLERIDIITGHLLELRQNPQNQSLASTLKNEVVNLQAYYPSDPEIVRMAKQYVAQNKFVPERIPVIVGC